ncbi:hypothetical protein NJ7G_2369 [Natrinema sp. J7-2]|nr:hypothetical protein NJ7G_2369 [Natrinema sp. J7-2]
MLETLSRKQLGKNLSDSFEINRVDAVRRLDRRKSGWLA